jgi:uroporphyrinogen decarboxylase
MLDADSRAFYPEPAMTSRERVRAVLDGRKADCIPNGLGATLNTGMHLLAYERLRTLLGIDGAPPRMMSFEANALFDLPMLRAVKADMVSLGLKITPARFWAPGHESDWKESMLWGRRCRIPKRWDVSVDGDGATWIDGFNWDSLNFNVPLDRQVCRLKCPADGRYFDPVAPEGLRFTENLTPEDYNPPRDFPQEWLRGIEESARWLHDETDYSIVCDEMINDFQLTPGGLDNWLMRMMSEPEIVHEFFAKAREAAISQLRLVDQAVGKYADLLMIAQDFGDLRGVSIGPDLWRRLFKPHFASLFAEWHRSTRMRIGMHSCGSIADILGDLIECGLDVINPVQVSARAMEAESLVQRFGGRIVFYGGSYDAVINPPETPPELVRQRVRENIRTLNRQGRYIFSGVHNIQWNVPESHLRAILSAFEECRGNGVA